MKLEYYNLNSFKGLLKKNGPQQYEFTNICGRKFAVYGHLDQYCGENVRIEGLPIWGPESFNEIIIKGIDKIEPQVA